MLSFIKNNIYCFLIVCIFNACNEKIDNEGYKTFKDTIGLSSVNSFTILLSGIIPAPMYSNAQDIVAKKYNINFIYAAGCIVNDHLRDSISKFNEQTFLTLKKHFNKNVVSQIFTQIDKETAFLIQLDSILRNNKTLKTTHPISNELIYYTKINKNYLANFILLEPVNKISTYKLKLSVSIDSAKKQILTVTLKDSLINYNFKNLNVND